MLSRLAFFLAVTCAQSAPSEHAAPDLSPPGDPTTNTSTKLVAPIDAAPSPPLGTSSTAGGLFTEAPGPFAVAMGYETRAEGLASSAMGRDTFAYSMAHTTVGQYNKLPESDIDATIAKCSTMTSCNSGCCTKGWSTADPVFQVGIGTSDSDRRDALTVLKSGKVEIPGELWVDGHAVTPSTALKDEVAAQKKQIATLKEQVAAQAKEMSALQATVARLAAAAK